MSLRADPSALAPERVLVFELRASIASFLSAIRGIPGLELVDEEEMDADEEDKSPVAYLLVPDAMALRQIESLWRRWQRKEPLGDVYMAGWRDAFALLKDLRPWGPQDRVDPQDAIALEQDIAGLGEEDRIRAEVELVFRRSGDEIEQALKDDLESRQGKVVARARIDEIGYHALLVELPVAEVRGILARSAQSIAGIDSIMHVRPQSVASTIELAEASPTEDEREQVELGVPILALLDGVPVTRHSLLEHHLIVDDAFGLEPNAQVSDRKHGTAMASLIVHGDRNLQEQSLPRRIHVLPVMTARSDEGETFPRDRLIVDMIYRAVRIMREGPDAAAPHVIIINISLGNSRQAFHGRLSAWARLLDRLAYQYGILFVVSAGNVGDGFVLDRFANRAAFEDADIQSRFEGVLRAVNSLMGQRRIISPSESINAITVGSCNADAVSPQRRMTARASVDPYADFSNANPSSALGPGYGSAVKPDILMPGSRERLIVVRSDGQTVEVVPAPPTSAAGLKVAAPPRSGQESYESYTNGTSASAALASRTCHRIHDALERAYGNAFLNLSHRERAVILKALLTHTAEWPEQTVELMKQILGPPDGRQHVKQKDNVRRYLGYGVVDAQAAVACAGDRATFWAVGEVLSGQMVHVAIPIPAAIAGLAQPHSIAATVAWLTPTHHGTKAYRSIRLKLLEPEEITELGLKSCSSQPDVNQSNRGTLFSRRWEGARAAVVSEDMMMRLHVQREPDQVGNYDDPIPFGLAVTIAMPGVINIYEQVQQRLGIRPVVPAGSQVS